MLRRLVVIPVAMLFGSIIAGLHYYMAQRMVVAAQWPEPVESLLLGLVMLLAALLFVAPIGERFLPPDRAKWLVWPSALWMGTGWLVLVGLLVTDAGIGLLGFVGSPELISGAARVRAVALVALVLPTVVSAVSSALGRPVVNQVRVGLDRWPEGLRPLRLVQITDIHIGVLLGRDFAQWLTDEVNRLQPDVIAVTGDLVDGTVEHLRDRVAPFAGLEAPMGVYFVTGNHDHYSGGRDWVTEIERLGLTPLRNRHVELEIDGHTVVLAGVDDHRGGFLPGDGGEDLDAALEGIHDAHPVILLAHDPTTFKEASKRDVDLQVSGHTHGGQIWPFHYLVRLAQPWVAGLHREGHSAIWVSRGTGSWGPPMRLGAPAEITNLSIGARLSPS